MATVGPINGNAHAGRRGAYVPQHAPRQREVEGSRARSTSQKALIRDHRAMLEDLPSSSDLRFKSQLRDTRDGSGYRGSRLVDDEIVALLDDSA